MSDDASQIFEKSSKLLNEEFNKTLSSLKSSLIDSESIIEKHNKKISSYLNESLTNLESLEEKMQLLNKLVFIVFLDAFFILFRAF